MFLFQWLWSQFPTCTSLSKYTYETKYLYERNKKQSNMRKSYLSNPFVRRLRKSRHILIILCHIKSDKTTLKLHTCDKISFTCQDKHTNSAAKFIYLEKLMKKYYKVFWRAREYLKVRRGSKVAGTYTFCLLFTLYNLYFVINVMVN